ncbi:MAG: adenosine kinase [Bdellovibrionales bacterium]|nr:adenosine kinase [Bdellovibrionales bacterium]NQZ18413.1 adenosine kinase [Bdellovibrionales bacterium]
MAKYNVYGVGNALVDMEIETTEEFLKKSQVEKGLMTLVDEKRQHELLDHIEGKVHKRSCGGSAANTMIAISQLGGQAFYSCKVASDETGDFYYKDLMNNGLNTNLGPEREEGITGKCLVFVTPDADRTMNSFLGITETFSKNEVKDEELAQSEYLYMEGYLVTSDTGRAAAIHAKKVAEEKNVKTSITLSDPGVVGFFKDGFKEMIGDGVDLIFCNEAEALSFTDTDNLEAAMEALKNHAGTIAVTRGPEGARLWDGEQYIEIEAPEVDAKDTNGAGDLFAGAFLYGLTHGHSFFESGKLACHCSSRLVTEFGARLEKDTIKQVYSEVFN